MYSSAYTYSFVSSSLSSLKVGYKRSQLGSCMKVGMSQLAGFRPMYAVQLCMKCTLWPTTPL